jgi:hypothetical protein
MINHITPLVVSKDNESACLYFLFWDTLRHRSSFPVGKDSHINTSHLEVGQGIIQKQAIATIE